MLTLPWRWLLKSSKARHRHVAPRRRTHARLAVEHLEDRIVLSGNQFTAVGPVDPGPGNFTVATGHLLSQSSTDLVYVDSGTVSGTPRLVVFPGLGGGKFDPANAKFVDLLPSLASGNRLGHVTLAVSDFNADGIDDVAVAYEIDSGFGSTTRLVDSGVKIYQGGASGLDKKAEFSFGTTGAVGALATGRFISQGSGDDIAVLPASNASATVVNILQNLTSNNGDPISFKATPVPSSALSRSVNTLNTAVLNDVNADLHADLAVAGKDGVVVLTSDGASLFKVGSTIALPGKSATRLVAANLSGHSHGTQDLAVLVTDSKTFAKSIVFLQGQSNAPYFAASVSMPPLPVDSGAQELLVADLDGDGIRDLATVNSFNATVDIYKGKGDGTFTKVTDPALPAGLPAGGNGSTFLNAVSAANFGAGTGRGQPASLLATYSTSNGTQVYSLLNPHIPGPTFTVNSSADPSRTGDPVTFTFHVRAGTGTDATDGTVTLIDTQTNATFVTSNPWSQGSITITLTPDPQQGNAPLANGPHVFRATYSGSTTGIPDSAPVTVTQNVLDSITTVSSRVDYDPSLGLPDTTSAPWTLVRPGSLGDASILDAALQISDPQPNASLAYTWTETSLQSSVAAFMEATFRLDTTRPTSGFGAVAFGLRDGAHRVELDFDHFDGFTSTAIFTLTGASGPAAQISVPDADQFHIFRITKDAAGNVSVQASDRSGNGVVSQGPVAATQLPVDSGAAQFFFGAPSAAGKSVSDWLRVHYTVGRTDDKVAGPPVAGGDHIFFHPPASATARLMAVTPADALAVQTLQTGTAVGIEVKFDTPTLPPMIEVHEGQGDISNPGTSDLGSDDLFFNGPLDKPGTDFIYAFQVPDILGAGLVKVVGSNGDGVAIDSLTTRILITKGNGSTQSVPPKLTFHGLQSLQGDGSGDLVTTPGQSYDFSVSATQADGHAVKIQLATDQDGSFITASDAGFQNLTGLVESDGTTPAQLFVRFTPAQNQAGRFETFSFEVVDKRTGLLNSNEVEFAIPDPSQNRPPVLELQLPRTLPDPTTVGDETLHLTIVRKDSDTQPLLYLPKIMVRHGATPTDLANATFEEYVAGPLRTDQQGRDFVESYPFLQANAAQDLGFYEFYAVGFKGNDQRGQSATQGFYLGIDSALFGGPATFTKNLANTGDLPTLGLATTSLAGTPSGGLLPGDSFATTYTDDQGSVHVVTGLISEDSSGAISRGGGTFTIKDLNLATLISEDSSGAISRGGGTLTDAQGFEISARAIGNSSGNVLGNSSGNFIGKATGTFQSSRYLVSSTADGHRFFALNSQVATNGIVAPGAGGLVLASGLALNSLALPGGHLVSPGAAGNLTFDNSAVAMPMVSFAASTVGLAAIKSDLSGLAAPNSQFFSGTQEIANPRGQPFAVRAAVVAPASSPATSSTPDGAAVDTVLRAQFLLWHAELLRLNGVSAADVQTRLQEAADLLDAGHAVFGPQGFAGLSAQQLTVLQNAAHVVKLQVAPANAGHAIAPGTLVVLTPTDAADTLATGTAVAPAGQALPLMLAGTLVTAGGSDPQPMQTGLNALPVQMYGQAARLVSAAPGQVEIRLPADLRTDRPQLIVLSTADGHVGLALIQLQAADFLPKNTGKFIDKDGDTYTVTLSGPGQVGVVLDDPTGTGKGPLDRIIVQGTDPAKSSLSVTVVKGKNGDGLVSIGSILGMTGLKSIAIGQSNLVGSGIILGNLLGALTVHDILNSAQVLAGGTAAQSTTLAAHVVEARTVINVGSSISSFSAASVKSGSITAASLGTLTIAGDATNKVNGVVTPIAGDFNAALTLTGTGDAKKPTALGSATINGGIHGGTWLITGDAGPINVKGALDGWSLTVHGNAGGLTLGTVAAATITVDKAVATLSAKGWASGSLTAASLGSLSITGDLGANVTLSGAGLAKSALALGAATISGKVNGSTLRVAGPVNSFTAGMFLNSSLFVGFTPTDAANPLGGGTFTAGLKLGSFTANGLPRSSAPAFVNSNVAAANVGTVNLKSVQTANGGKKFGVIAHTAIGAVAVTTPAFKFNKAQATPQGIDDFEVVIG